MGPLFSVVTFSLIGELFAVYITEGLVFQTGSHRQTKGTSPSSRALDVFVGDSWLGRSEATDFSLHSFSVFPKF